MKELIITIFYFELMQTKWGRKWMKGTFYYIKTALVMAPFWSDKKIKTCQAAILKVETY